MTPLRLGTRGSHLALWQARHVAALLVPFTDRPVELVRIDTHGDRDQASALSQMGGFGVFTKAIQQALLDGRVDIAVHSLKDLPTLPTAGVSLAATPERGPTGDAFVSPHHARLDDIPPGSVVGTSSLRRRAQVLNRRPDLRLVDLRGNVETRLRKLRDENLAGIVLAEAGLMRLGLTEHIAEILPAEWMLPAVGQGAIGLECRDDDGESRALAQAVNHGPTWQQVRGERAMLFALGGGCVVPIGVSARLEAGRLTLRGVVLSPDGERRIVATERGPADAPLAVGQELAARLLNEGAAELLAGAPVPREPEGLV